MMMLLFISQISHNIYKIFIKHLFITDDLLGLEIFFLLCYQFLFS